MNYVIIDMEWNQALSPQMMVQSPVLLSGEIIQIGAVKTDENFNLVDKIKINVCPKYYKKMNKHVQKITGITNAQLGCGERFPVAFRRLSEWCGEDFRFVTWGFDDINMLADNLRLHGLPHDFGADYVNLQLIYREQVDSERVQCALGDAAERLGIPLDAQAHDAMNDAWFTYEVLKKLDMKKGLEMYPALAARVKTALRKDVIRNVSDNRKMNDDKRVRDAVCPRCENILENRDWVYFGGGKKSTIASCREHGDFLVKLTCKKISEGNFTVSRTIYDCDEEAWSAYEAKLQKQKDMREKHEKHKKGKRPVITTVLFDLDGTLLPFEQEDFVKMYFGELCKKLAPLGYKPDSTVKAVWAGTGAMIKNDGTKPNSERFWETFNALNVGMPDAKPLCDAFYLEEFDNARACLKYIPDVKGIIDELKAAGLRVVLATNPIFPENGVLTRMKWVGLSADDFELITHYDNSTYCKPNPKYFEEILTKIGEAPENCLMVGNNISEDMLAAESVGMKVFFVPDFAENPNGEDTSRFEQGSLSRAAEYALSLAKK
ncbi:MAG: HAD-IA family hydrolase [Oscillospiraceae bacterium]|nr:HAD-IA family hydrolase [Oscillospiraceae bacterium]